MWIVPLPTPLSWPTGQILTSGVSDPLVWSFSPSEATCCGVGCSLPKDEDPTPHHVASVGLNLLVGLKLWG